MEERKPPAALLDIEIDQPNIFADLGGEIKRSPIYEKYKSKFASTAHIDPEKVKGLALPSSNATQLREMIASWAKEGVIFEDSAVRVKIKSEYTSFLARHLIHCIGKTGTLDAITVDTDSPKGLEVQCSKIKYPAPGSSDGPMFMIQMMMSEPFDRPPVLSISFKNGKAEFGLPVFVTKFMEQKELTLASASSLWKQFAGCPNNIDAILKNPAPSSLSCAQVLMKIAQLLHDILGFYVVPPEDEKMFTSFYASGKINIKSPGQTKFPASPDEIKPPVVAVVIVETEFYPDVTMAEFRFSIRSSSNIPVPEQILSLFKLFVRA